MSLFDSGYRTDCFSFTTVLILEESLSWRTRAGNRVCHSYSAGPALSHIFQLSLREQHSHSPGSPAEKTQLWCTYRTSQKRSSPMVAQVEKKEKKKYRLGSVLNQDLCPVGMLFIPVTAFTLSSPTIPGGQELISIQTVIDTGHKLMLCCAMLIHPKTFSG